MRMFKALGVRYAWLLVAALTLLAVALPLSPVRTQEVQDLTTDQGVQQQRLISDLKERVRTLYSQGRYKETIEVCDRLLAVEPDNSIAIFFKNSAETRIQEGRLEPVESVAVPTPRATPVPVLETAPPPPPPKRSPMDSLRDNKMLVLILGGALVLLIVVAIVAMIILRRSRQEFEAAIKNAPQGASAMHDMATSRAATYEDPATGPMADMPTHREPAPAAQPAAVTVPAEPSPAAAAQAAREREVAPMSSDNIKLDMAPTASAPEESREIVIGEFSASTNYTDVLSDSQAPDIEATKDKGVDAPPSVPFQPPRSSAGMALPPMVPESSAKDVAPSTPFAETFVAGPGSIPPPVGEETFAGGFAAPPPAPMAAPAPAADPFAGGFAPPPPAAPSSAPTEDANAMSFNSLMFGPGGGAPQPQAPASQGLRPATPPPAPELSDDMTKNSFNQQFGDVMFGSGAEQTGFAAPPPASSGVSINEEKTLMMPGMGFDAPAPPTPEDATMGPAAAGGGIALPSMASAPASSDQASGKGNEATVNVTPSAKPAPAGATSGSMFQRQYDAGKAAFDAGDFAKAVQCLSVAASLKPADLEVRALLDEARKRRKA